MPQPNAALQRMMNREKVAPVAAEPEVPEGILVNPAITPEQAEEIRKAWADQLGGEVFGEGEEPSFIELVEKDDAGDGASLGNTGALQGPLQGDESKGGAMSSPGVRGAVEKPKAVPRKNVAPKPATQPLVAQTKAAITKRPDVSPKEGEHKYGDVKFADPKNKKYPLDTDAHVRNAWSRINQPTNARKYSPAEVKTIKGHIKAEAKKRGIEIADEASKETYIAPKRPALWNRNKVGVVVTKGADGRRTMMMFTANSYRDREREAIATRALAQYVDKAWSAVEDKCLPRNELRFWHSGVIGDIVYADMEGPFLIEVAKERPNKLVNLARPGQRPFLVSVKEVWDYLEENPDDIDWGASHGFKFYKGRRSADGVYKQIYKFESSVLPLQWAANPYTFSGVVDMEPRQKLLQQLVGRANAKALRQGARSLKSALDNKGIQHKEKKPDQAETASKGLLEDLEAKISEALGDITDDPEKAKQLQDDLMQTIVECLADGGTPEPEATDGTEEEAAEGYHYDAMDGEGEEEVPQTTTMGRKELALLDTLIQSQEGILEAVEGLVERQKSLEKVTELPDAVASLGKRMKALEVQLKMRPQAASESDDTEVEDPDLMARVKKAMSNYDPFFGVHVEGE